MLNQVVSTSLTRPGPRSVKHRDSAAETIQLGPMVCLDSVMPERRACDPGRDKLFLLRYDDRRQFIFLGNVHCER